MSFQAACPACGAPVQFDVANSVVTVCGSCSTVVGRGDGKLEDFGKVSDLVQTDSPLSIGLKGEYKGVRFEITGRSQIKHSAGGTWDEWYVAFRGGKKWGWLAEAEGRFYLTFEKKLPEKHSIPAFSALGIEEEITVPGVGGMKVVEIGEATTASAQGEIPYAFKPNETVRFVDLEGKGKRFGTIDFSGDVPMVFIGGEVTLEQLGISEAVKDREKEERRVGSVQVNCPSCGGPLELRAPDDTQRVACQFCGGLSEVDQGNLKFLKTLGDKKVEPVIPLGTVGKIPGSFLGAPTTADMQFTVIGFMQRRVKYEGRNYYWHEYLLYKPRHPFLWMLLSNGHWSLGKPISPSEVDSGGHVARYGGETFKLYDRGEPDVTYVLGEFYWQVSIGEKVHSTDFICPPHILSREHTWQAVPSAKKKRRRKRDFDEADEESDAGKAVEVNYTLARYCPVEDVEKMFGIKGLRRSFTVAPNQPYPLRGIYAIWMTLLLASVLVGILIFTTGKNKKIYAKSFALTTTPPVNRGPGQPFSAFQTQPKVFFSEQPLKIEGGGNILITGSAPVDNSWVYAAGDFYNEKTGVVQPFELPIEYYHGSSGGESWSEGGRSTYDFVSALPDGEYTLRLEVQWDPKKPNPSSPLAIEVRQGVPRWLSFFLLMLALSIMPIGIGIHHYSFEVRRWQESDYSPFNTE